MHRIYLSSYLTKNSSVFLLLGLNREVENIKESAPLIQKMRAGPLRDLFRTKVS